jgi:3-oxoacyl-[acyl-carrier-protein] synthase II
MGCHIGAGLIAAETAEMSEAMHTARTPDGRLDLRMWGGSGGDGVGTGMEQLTPLWLLKYLPNMLACHVTIVHGCEGPSNTITCAEASGLLCVGESTRVIERGAADLCFSGGVESKLNPMGMLRLDLSGWIAPTGDEEDGSRIVRPYDAASKGGLVGEGGGVLILESLETAKKRGARVYAEVAGVGGGASDTFYKDGEQDEGYRFAILNALDDAGIGPEKVDAIVAMASGVPNLDRAEFGAFKSVFGDRLKDIPLVTLGASVGTCMAGNGALQVAAAAGCLHQQKLPARIHCGTARAGLQAGQAGVRAAKLEYVLACSGALGGQNAAVVLKRAAT